VELSKHFPDGSLSSDTGCADYERNEIDNVVIDQLCKKLIGLGLPLMADTLKFHFLEYRTNPDVFKWHNDNGSHFANHNVTINCFFDDTSEETGGRFDVCQLTPVSGEFGNTTQDREQMFSLYPKKFTIVVFNQNPDFLHKVTPTKNLRRMISYAGSLF
jgi:predicted 2-oxoglutarate/Fe(II)-dependent dioxygenase YbiX